MEEDLNKLKVIKRRRKSIVRSIVKSDIPNFKSIYAKILYLELEKRKPSTDFEISLEELKHILMVPNLAYVYSHLRLRVLDSIMKEFNEVNSPLQFSYEIIKKNEKDIVKFKTKNKLIESNLKLFQVLSYIGEKLNNENIFWAVGGSIVLNHYGLVDSPNDIDIIVHKKDVETLDNILKSLGDKKGRDETKVYSTEYFYEYNICDVDIDVMSGFIINHSSGMYKYPFDQESIGDFKDINGVKVPISSLEDWYVAYQLMPSREQKVKLIEGYLRKEGIKNPNLLKRALLQELPKQVEKKVKSMMRVSENL